MSTGPKFKVGDWVRCRKPSLKVDIIGRVMKVNNTGNASDHDYEYWVTNSPKLLGDGRIPLLWWEFEMTPAPKLVRLPDNEQVD